MRSRWCFSLAGLIVAAAGLARAGHHEDGPAEAGRYENGLAGPAEAGRYEDGRHERDAHAHVLSGFSRTLVPSAFRLAPQTPAVFEVASVRPDDARQAGGIRLLPTGQFTATAVTLHDLIVRAYAIHESQLVDAPDWTRDERYSIVARSAAPPPGGTAGLLPMLQALLAERFALRMRTQRRPLSAFVLTPIVAGRLGAGIRPSTIDCAANAPSPVPNTMSLSADGWPPCGLTLMRTMIGDIRNRIEVIQAAVPISELAFRLQALVGRPVVDRTALSGTFDIRFVYAQQTATNPGGVAATPSDAPDLFSAMREQLGFELESKRAQVPVLVVESVERPAGN